MTAESWKIQATLKLRGGDLMLNVRADTEAEFAGRMEWLAERFPNLSSAVLRMAAGELPGPERPAGDAPTCTHDGVTKPKEFKTGTRRVDGEPYRAWACWLPKERGDDRCPFDFID